MNEANLNEKELEDLCFLMSLTANGTSIKKNDTKGFSKATFQAFVDRLDNLGIK